MLKHLKVTTKLIASFNPCADRFNNWTSHYDSFDGDVIDFLFLDKITAKDKVWVCVRILPRDLVETFAVDSAFSAYAAAAAAAYAAADAAAADAAYAAADAAAAYAADDAADAAAAAAADDARDAERERQVDALIYLIEHYEEA